MHYRMFVNPPSRPRPRMDFLWFKLAADEFPSPATWPAIWRAIFYDTHKSHSDRYRLFVFMWQNGMVPYHALFWTMINGDYDSAAWRHMFAAYTQTFTIAGRALLNRNRVFNFNLRTVV